MKEHSLNCDDRTALAIYEGRQTQDRRPLTKRRVDCGRVAFEDLDFSTAHAVKDRLVVRGKDEQLHIVTPQVKVGDVVWIREAWREVGSEMLADNSIPKGEWLRPRDARYRADDPSDGPWRASIHMPRWACRSLRRVTRVWFERVQDISEADARAEGIFAHATKSGQDYYSLTDMRTSEGYWSARGAFRCLYDSIYPGAWDENGWNVCKEFEPIEEA